MEEKMRMESVDLTAQNIEKIGTLFPNCITEVAGKDGSICKSINFNILRQMLSDDIVEGDEAYEFTWVGKKAAIAEANKPIRKTLRPCPEESIDWDTTENLYIEGDNLEVLKLLQESYLGKVKMIYIDPPYNTGNDFIYRDDFAQSAEDYAEQAGVYGEDGNMLFKNTDSNGRFHSDWCSMIYSRLLIAKNLLSIDGLIFISIDDNEQATLKKICDEIFGESRFITTICVETSNGLFGLKAKFADNTIVKSKDYILVYKNSEMNLQLQPLYTKSKNNFDTHFTFYKKDNFECSLNSFLQESDLVSCKAALLGVTASISNLSFIMDVFPDVKDFIIGEAKHIYRIRDYTLKLSDEQKALLSDGNKHIINDTYVFIDKKGNPQYLYPFSKVIRKSDDYNAQIGSCVIQGDLWKGFNDDMGNIGKEGNVSFENGKKPVRLIKNLIKLVNDKNCTILDFFSGSGTTAHAVMKMNAEDEGNRKFILVQIPESCRSSTKYENICELAKDRLINSAKQVSEEYPEAKINKGFRVFKLDDSNMNDVYYAAGDYTQDILSLMETNIKTDRTDLDLLFGCLLEWGLPLSMPYISEQINDCTVHTYNDGDLIACFDESIPDSVIREVAKRQPLRAVFRDGSFKDSPSKINVGEIFKMLAPDTRVKVI